MKGTLEQKDVLDTRLRSTDVNSEELSKKKNGKYLENHICAQHDRDVGE